MDRPHKLTLILSAQKRALININYFKITRDKLSRGSNIPVRLVKEPLNPCDSRAIAFKCEVDNKWYTIGYVVREEVRGAMDRSRL